MRLRPVSPVPRLRGRGLRGRGGVLRPIAALETRIDGQSSRVELVGRWRVRLRARVMGFALCEVAL